MHRHFVSVAAAFFLAAAVAAPAAAHSTSMALGDETDFSWALISGENQSMSTGRFDSETIERLKERYGDELLIVSDKDDRYVITDDEMLARARRSARKIRDYQGDIGQMAAAQARLSMGENDQSERIGQLERRRRSLEREIRSEERRGNDTQDLEQELFQVRIQIRALSGVQRSFQLTSDEKRDLTRQRDRASERLNRGMRRINAEIREILEDAKEQGLAKRVR